MEESELPELLRERRALYERAIALRNRGLKVSEIWARLGVSEGVVAYWFRFGKPKRVSRYEPNLEPSSDLAYVAGFYIGDGKDAGEEHKVRFQLADRQQLEYVGGLVAKILRRPPKPIAMEDTFYNVQYDSVALSEFLNQDFHKLLDYLKDFGGDFLRGFFDAEGYASAVVDFKSNLITSMVVGAANTNLTYLDKVGEILSELKIPWARRVTNKKGGKMTIRGRTFVRKHDVYHVVIRGFDAAGRFLELVGFENRTKREKLMDLVSLQNKAPRGRYGWFMAHYEKRGQRRVKLRKEG